MLTLSGRTWESAVEFGLVRRRSIFLPPRFVTMALGAHRVKDTTTDRLGRLPLEALEQIDRLIKSFLTA